METEYFTNKLLRVIDIVGMVIAPISGSLPLFQMGIQNYQRASSTGTNYNEAIVIFFVALLIFICLVYFFGKGLKLYVFHQETRNDVMAIRAMYFAFILAGFIMYFIGF